MALTYDAQWAQWRKDIERIYRETVYVFENRHVFRKVMEMFEKNNALQTEGGGFVWDWLYGMYGRDMVTAVGRELDRTTEVVNLIQLMYQMTKRPPVVSRKRFLATQDIRKPKPNPGGPPSSDAYVYRRSQEWFSRNIGAGAFLDVAKVKADRNWLEKRCRRVMKYRHKIVAHRSTMELTLTATEINNALDAIEKMLKKYYGLFTGGSLVGVEPTIQFNWESTFDIPWRQATP